MKKSILVAILFLSGFDALHAQTRQTREEYIDRYKHIAVAHMERYGDVLVAVDVLLAGLARLRMEGAEPRKE